MHSSTPEPPSAPGDTFPSRLLEVLGALGTPAFAGLDNDLVVDGVTQMFAAAELLTAFGLGFLAEADRRDLATEHGAVNTAALLRKVAPHPLSGVEASALVKLARGLEQHEPTRTAVHAGEVSVRHGGVVLAAVAKLPAVVGPEVREQAETHLLGEAKKFPVKELQALGDHVLEVLDPAAADAKLAARLEADERAAARKTSFQLWHNADGLSFVKAQIPTFAAIQLETMLHAIANPLRADGIPTETTRELEVADPDSSEITYETQTVDLDSPERMGLAFVDLISRIPAARLPKTGGGVVKVVVTIPLATLMGGLAAAAVFGVKQHQLSPGEARRLACELGVIPMVLNGDSIVLDAGRQQRLHDDQQRTAMIVQQHGTCGIADCDRPALWGEAHHPHEWGDGGVTNTADGVILCPRHHSLAHTNHLRLTRHPDKTWTLDRTKRRRP